MIECRQKIYSDSKQQNVSKCVSNFCSKSGYRARCCCTTFLRFILEMRRNFETSSQCCTNSFSVLFTWCSWESFFSDFETDIDIHTFEAKSTISSMIFLCRKQFYKPDGWVTDDEDVNAEVVADNGEMITFQIEEVDSDSDVEVFDAENDSDNDSDMDSDSTTEEEPATDDRNAPGGSSMRSPDNPDPGDEDEDDVVQAIIAATKTKRAHPPDIVTEDFIVDLSFHPTEDLLAVGTINGDVIVYRCSNEENELVNTIEVHTKAVRDIEFNADGSTLFTVSKDKSIMMSDVSTGKLKRFYDNSHESPIYKMHILTENMFATGKASQGGRGGGNYLTILMIESSSVTTPGDEDGTVKLWDLRERDTKPIFSLKEVDDYISAILTNEAKKILLTTSGDGLLTAFNIGAR